jgi:hypothetical protein
MVFDEGTSYRTTEFKPDIDEHVDNNQGGGKFADKSPFSEVSDTFNIGEMKLSKRDLQMMLILSVLLSYVIYNLITNWLPYFLRKWNSWRNTTAELKKLEKKIIEII